MVACYCLIDVEHRPGGQADSQHAAGQLMPIFTCKALVQYLGERIAIDEARGVGREPRITCQLRYAKELTELPESGVISGGDEDLAGSGLELGIGNEIRVRVAGRSAIRMAIAEKRPVAISTIGVPRRVAPLVSVPLIDISPTIACSTAS